MYNGSPAVSGFVKSSHVCHGSCEKAAGGAHMPLYSLLIGRGARFGGRLVGRMHRRGLRSLLASAGAGMHRTAPLARTFCALTAVGALLPQVPSRLSPAVRRFAQFCRLWAAVGRCFVQKPFATVWL